MINAQVEKMANENNPGLVRRFTKRVQETGVLNKARSLRYYGRNASLFLRRKQALKLKARREEVAHLIKMGKMSPRPARRRRY